MYFLILLLILLLPITMASNESLDTRIQKALAEIPSEHRLPPSTGKLLLASRPVEPGFKTMHLPKALP